MKCSWQLQHFPMLKWSMNIYVIGTGGVGGFFGGKLALAGNDVTFLARGESYEKIKSEGLVIKSVDGDFSINPAKVINSYDEITNPDLIFFAVKTYDTEEVAKALAEHVTSESVIISFQNGIRNELAIQQYVKSAEVYPGIAYVISAKIAPNIISQTGGLKRLVFGDKHNSNNQKLKKIEELFRDAGIDAILSSDIEADVWKKYIFINAFAGMTALLSSPIGKILENADYTQMYEDCVRENIAIAKKMNVNLPETIFEDTMKLSRNTNPAAKSSLLIDIENNRRTEIESLNGMIVRLAAECAVDVPVNEKIYRALNGK